MEDLWNEIIRKCLQQATSLLDKDTTPTEATVRAVHGLVETAIIARKSNNELPLGPGKIVCLEEI